MCNSVRSSNAIRSKLMYQMYKNNARSRPFCRTAKRSIGSQFGIQVDLNCAEAPIRLPVRFIRGHVHVAYKI